MVIIVYCLWLLQGSFGIFGVLIADMPLNLKITPVVETGQMQPGEKIWLKRLDQIITKNLNDNTFCNQHIVNGLGISERQLIRKVKERSGMSPRKYIRQFRLTKAMSYLKSGKYKTVKDTSLAVGISKVSYFISQFEQNFGKKPYQVLQDNGWR